MVESDAFNPYDWQTVAPRYTALLAEPLLPADVPSWLARWSDLERLLGEAEAATFRAMSEDTTDATAEQQYQHFLTGIKPHAEQVAQALKTKLLAVEHFEPALEQRELMRRLRTEADLYREANVQLRADVDARANDYFKLAGAWTVHLDGAELTMSEAAGRLLDPDRNVRETAWRAMEARRLRDRDALNMLFLELTPPRQQLASNAGHVDYRAYKWCELKRFDYTPDESLGLAAAIEAEIVPLLARLNERRQHQLGVATLRPWDLMVDPLGRPPLKPFTSVDQLEEGAARIFAQVDPELGAQWTRMRTGFLDLAARKGKAPGAFCSFFPRTGMPYIFMNAVGTHFDLVAVLHEAGHAFHAFAANAAQPLIWNMDAPMEFKEVASIAMELLGLPYLSAERGGFYGAADARRARDAQFEGIVRFLCGVTRAEVFQHWVYAEAPADLSAAAIDAKWTEVDRRFGPGVDWSGLEASRASGWQWIPHVFVWPFYVIEYVLAQLGAVQIWRNALEDLSAALWSYRAALALGNTRPLPELYQTAGARLPFDRALVRELADLLATQLELA